MALTLLADDWARTRGGMATALVVDHGLRPESAAEAETVGDWLVQAGITVVRLTWQGAIPTSDKQAAARQIRYHLMQAWCRQAGVLHLLIGHQQEDQAETFLLRLARGSGVDGLSAMAPLVETPDLRLLRPLLDVPKEQLLAGLSGDKRPFVRDPSNSDKAFARVRMRGILPILESEGLTTARLTSTARRMTRARSALDAAATALLACVATVYPEGYATITPDRFREAPEEVGLRALSRLLSCIDGSTYGPRLERLERLYGWLLGKRSEGAGRTLAGCRIVRRGDKILMCREARAAQSSVTAIDGVVWDRRFRLVAGSGLPKGLRIDRLGRAGWGQLVGARPELRRTALPALVRDSLPALWALDEVIEVPHLNYRRDGGAAGEQGPGFKFLPGRPLTAAACCS